LIPSNEEDPPEGF